MRLCQEVLSEVYDLSHTRLQRIQECHSAAEQLIGTLASLRQLPKPPQLQFRKQCLQHRHSFLHEISQLIQDQSCTALWDWLAFQLQDHPVLLELIHTRQKDIRATLFSLVKQCFDSPYDEDLHCAEECIRRIGELEATPTREEVLEIDSLRESVESKDYGEVVKAFNTQVTQFLQFLLETEQHILRSFNESLYAFGAQTVQPSKIEAYRNQQLALQSRIASPVRSESRNFISKVSMKIYPEDPNGPANDTFVDLINSQNKYRRDGREKGSALRYPYSQLNSRVVSRGSPSYVTYY